MPLTRSSRAAVRVDAGLHGCVLLGRCRRSDASRLELAPLTQGRASRDARETSRVARQRGWRPAQRRCDGPRIVGRRELAALLARSLAELARGCSRADVRDCEPRPARPRDPERLHPRRQRRGLEPEPAAAPLGPGDLAAARRERAADVLALERLRARRAVRMRGSRRRRARRRDRACRSPPAAGSRGRGRRRPSRGRDDGALDHVRELAHVARPVVARADARRTPSTAARACGPCLRANFAAKCWRGRARRRRARAAAGRGSGRR